MFAPFLINTPTPLVHTNGSHVVHWGNVDTGSMVNIIYSGVLHAFPELREFQKPFSHVVKGVGDHVSAIICKLEGVPLCLGKAPTSDMWVEATFYVLECPQYHFILGIPFLASVDGGVYCKSRKLTYPSASGENSPTVTLNLQPRAEARASEAFKHATQILTNLLVEGTRTQAKLPTIPESWEASLVEPDVLAYVQEGLVDIAAYAAMEGDKTQYCSTFPILPSTTVVDTSLATTPTVVEEF